MILSHFTLVTFQNEIDISYTNYNITRNHCNCGRIKSYRHLHDIASSGNINQNKLRFFFINI